MKVLVAILATLVITMAIAPAYATIVELKTENTSYKKGDKIVFIGKTDAAHANKIVAVRVADPNGKGVMLREVFTDSDGNFKTTPIDTSVENTAVKFAVKGVYNATAFYSQEPQPQKIWKFTLFDYSADGSPVSPSAADLMQQNQAPSTPPPATPPPTSPPVSTPPPTPQPEPEESQEPKCGTGTVLKDGVCVVAQAEPEPEPEPEPEVEPEPEAEQSGPKKTHIPGFPDPTKDPQYYIDRYNNEPKYKEWFDKNFPDDTIYAIVGVVDPGEANACGLGTHLEDGVCVLDKESGLFGGGCLIATAAFGSELAPQVQLLREVRDNVLATSSGASFMTGFNSVYYTFSPAVADLERANPAFKELVKTAITPMLSTLSILNHVDIDSESEMIGYGLGIMLLNAGMYFVAPALVIVKLRQFVKSRV